MAATTYLHNDGVQVTSIQASDTSTGVSDAGKIPALNDSGVLDSTIINAVTISAGAADEDKIPMLNASGVLDSTIINSVNVSSGAGDVGKIPKLDAAGKLDSSMMPVSVGPVVVSITASENLTAGDFVNVHDSGGARVQRTNATAAGKEAHGFVLASVTSGDVASVYFSGSNTGVTGLTPGLVYLTTVNGQVSGAAPSTEGNVIQKVGIAVSATEIVFQPQMILVI